MITTISQYINEIKNEISLLDGNQDDVLEYQEHLEREFEKILISQQKDFSSQLKLEEEFVRGLEPPRIMAESLIGKFQPSQATEYRSIFHSKLESFFELLIDQPVRWSLLLGFFFSIVTALSYNLTFAQFRPAVALILYLLVFYFGFKVIQRFNQKSKTVSGLVSIQLIFLSIIAVYFVIEFTFHILTGKFIVQAMGGSFDILEYSSTYFSILYLGPFEVQLISAFHPLFVLLMIILLLINSFWILLIFCVKQKVKVQNWNKYLTNLFLVLLVLSPGLIAINSTVNSSDPQYLPIKKVEGSYFTFSSHYENNLRVIDHLGVTIIFQDERGGRFVLENITKPIPIFEKNYVTNIRNTYKVGYESLPLLSETKINESFSQFKEFSSFTEDPNYKLPANFPKILELNLSLSINSSIIENYSFYYAQNDTNRITVYQKPHYFVKEFYSDHVIEKAYDILRHELVYYGFNNTNKSSDQSNPLNSFQLIKTDVFRTFNHDELIQQGFTDILAILLSLSVPIALLAVSRIKKRD